MKNIPGSNHPKRMSREEMEKMASKDKRKVLFMVLGLLILLGAFYATTYTAKKQLAGEEERLAQGVEGQEATPETKVYVPEFPEPAKLEAIRDGSKAERIVLNEPAILATLKYVQKLTPAQLEGLGLRTFAPEDLPDMTANPGEYRLQAFRARGKIIQLRHREATETAPGTYVGTLENTQGLRAHFIVSSDEEEKDLDTEYVRIDGLFVQMFEKEIDRWHTVAPLLVARSLSKSYAPIVLNENLETPDLATVRDDQVGEIWEFPELAQWQLMAKAQQDNGRIDWETAPMLNDEFIGRMLDGDDSLRGQPFRIPIRKNMGTRTVKAKENPFYRDEVMEGWMGDFTSKKGDGLLRWTGAFDKPELHDFTGDAELVTGRGFFLKAWVYEKRDGQPGRVPYFVMQSVDVHTPEPDMSHTRILWGMLGLTGIMVLVISWLLARDKRQSAELQKRLLERRRARRDREAQSPS